MLLLSDPALRSPRMRVLVDGALLQGATAAFVESNNHYAADRFHLAVAMGADPSRSMAAWAEAASADIEVQATLDGWSWTSLIEGTVDQLEMDPLAGRLRLFGRDRSAALIEARTTETFANRTASEIAVILAGRHGLAAKVQSTSTPVGRYWQLEHDQITLDQFNQATTEWDLLVTLAEREGFDVWVSGRTLFFQSPAISGTTPAVLRPGDLSGLWLERALALAERVEVTVKSWHSRQGAMICENASSAPGHEGRVRRYVYVVPNLTPESARLLARTRLAELVQHERVLIAEMPGDLTLTPRTTLALEGTGTAFDQTYRIDEIERRLHVVHGFTQCIRARKANVPFGSSAEEGA